MKQAIERLSRKFEDFAADLRNILEDADLPGGRHEAGYGEEPDDYVEKANPVRVAARNGIDDDTTITMKSGDLRKVVDSYRALSRYARTGRIPTQEERFKLHQAVKAVKHLIRKPHRDRH